MWCVCLLTLLVSQQPPCNGEPLNITGHTTIDTPIDTPTISTPMNATTETTTPTPTTTAAPTTATPTPIPTPALPTTTASPAPAPATTTAATSATVLLSRTTPPQRNTDTCVGLAPLADQPVHSAFARITFCTLPTAAAATAANVTDESTAAAPTFATTPTLDNIPLVNAIFYADCIEDTENATALAPLWASPCDDGVHARFVYGDMADEQLYVLQNGSLLRTSGNHTEYDVFDTYCLFEVKAVEGGNGGTRGQWLAQVCYDHVVSVSRAEAYLYAICMLVSVPCLLATAYFYLAIPQLRNLHGKSLACHSLCLALGFLLLSVVQIRGSVGTKTGYFIQYFLLACFLWLAVMCVDICTKVW